MLDNLNVSFNAVYHNEKGCNTFKDNKKQNS